MVTVILTDGLQRKTLSVVRSLGKKGIRTIVGEKDAFSPAGCSKFAHQSFVYPNPETKPNAFYASLLEQINGTSRCILYPMDDVTTSIIMENREELEKRCHIPLPQTKSFRIASDKYETTLLAKSAKVDYPLTFMPSSYEELKCLTNGMEYPVVIKPRKSSGSRGIRVANDAKELVDLYGQIHKEYPFPLIQEFIPQGERYDVCLIYDHDHQLKGSFIQKELRHFPIEMGPSTVQESVEHPELLEISKKLMEELNWTGIVEIEYMIDPRNGSPKLMEINPRYWNSLELSIQCGVDFPYLLLQVALKESFENRFHYDVGKRTRWLIPGDILHFVTNKNRFRMNPSFISKKRSPLKDDSFLLSDPLPTLANVAACFRYGINPNTWKMMFKR
jgi:predicted ATP-grasp superfamily ATP-dependent carboligase